MLQQFEERGWDVGLVVDLTFTDRYYDPQVSSTYDTVFVTTCPYRISSAEE